MKNVVGHRLPDGWEVKKISDVFTVERGGSPRPIKKYLTDSADGLNWIKIGDASASNKYIYETKEKIIVEGLKKTRFVKEGDFLLSNSMSFGRPYIMKTTGCIHDGWLVLRDKKKYEIDQNFLYYILCSPIIFFQFDLLAAGSTVRNLNIALVSSVEIPIPPIAEQKRIVAILDEAFAFIDKAKENAEKNLANAKELFESHLNGIFANPGEDWDEKTIQKITLKVGSGATPLGGQKAYKDSGISLIRSLNIHDDEFKYENLAFINESQAEKLSNVIIKSRDVLLNITGASIARCNIVPDNVLPARVNQHVSIIRLKPDMVMPEFLHFMLISKSHKERLLLSGDKNGATRQALTKALINNYQISYPNLETQEQIIKKTQTIKLGSLHLKEIYQQKIAALEELKKSILKKAFEGEL